MIKLSKKMLRWSVITIMGISILFEGAKNPTEGQAADQDGMVIQRQGLGTLLHQLPDSTVELGKRPGEDNAADSGNKAADSGNKAAGPGNHAGTGSVPASGADQDRKKILGGAKINLLTNQTASQMMSLIIETSKGGLIVIDGGLPEDADHLANAIRSRGGHVKAWLITHPHSDHVGALNQILTKGDSQITIDQIYYSFVELDWYYANEEYRADMVKTVMETFSKLPQGMLRSDIARGTKIQVDDINITVMNKPYLFGNNAINNSSVAYMLEINKKQLLVLGDMGPEAGDQLLNDYQRKLSCDIVQMSHHGQYGVNQEVYKILNPSICLWPTPGWLWENDNGGGAGSGPWFTLETRQWMSDLGVRENYSIKDGDQVIE